MANPKTGTRRQLAAVRWRERRRALREWLLEDQAAAGLGGPPNNWRSIAVVEENSPFSGAAATHGARFTNDAGEIALWLRFDEPDDRGRTLAIIPTWVFRRFALWYLWRWAWGEWFGLRRRIYYRWLRRWVARMMVQRDARATKGGK